MSVIGSRSPRWTSTLAVAALVLTPTAMAMGASAATLQVSAGPVQYWDLPVQITPPEPPPPSVPTACGAVGGYAGVLQAEPGVTLSAPDSPRGKNLGWILLGTNGPDVLVGNNKKDCLVGGGGDDVLFGENDSDILLGGAGDDTLHGGNGKDTLDPGGQPGDTCADLGTNETCTGVPPAAATALTAQPEAAPQPLPEDPAPDAPAVEVEQPQPEAAPEAPDALAEPDAAPEVPEPVTADPETSAGEGQ